MINFQEFLAEIAVRRNTRPHKYKTRKWVKRRRNPSTLAFRTARTANKNAVIAKKNNQKMYRRIRRKR